MDTGDTAWVLIATALVMLMTPAGLALFYGGLSNKKNVINTVGMSYVAFCVATLAWVAVGYSIAFGPEGHPIFGSIEALFLKNIAPSQLMGSIPELAFVAFQGVFAAIAVAIISGSVIGRLKFNSWIIFSTLVGTICLRSFGTDDLGRWPFELFGRARFCWRHGHSCECRCGRSGFGPHFGKT
jgi:Amt family ammonium transporter